MYPDETMTTSSIAIPRTRRRYLASPLSASRVAASPLQEQREVVKGYAHLCFCEDGSWFEGHLIAKDESQYGLSGRCPATLASAATALFDQSPSPPETSGDENLSSSPPFVAYDVTVNDHDDEEAYVFPSVLLTSSRPLCALLSPRFSFTGEQSYRGQRADMLIQRYLTPRLVGKNLRVCAGHATLDLNPPTRALSDSYRGGGPLWCL